MKEVKELISKSRRITLVGHVHADGDVIGSMAALHGWLAPRVEAVFPFLFEPIPERYAFLQFDSHAKIFDPCDLTQRKAILDSDLLFILDLSVEQRLPGWSDILAEFKGTTICIDHHPQPEIPLGRINIIEPQSCATGQILHELFRLDGGKITREEALGLFTAITTDTGWFRYSNTKPEVLALAAALLEHGIDPAEIYGFIYQSKALDHIRLLGKAVGKVNEALNGELLWVTLTGKEMKETGLEDLETEDLLDLFRSVKVCRCIVLFRETGNGAIRVNLRSKGDLYIHKLAERFGGGGHRKAAGITFRNVTIDEARDQVVHALIEFMNDERSSKDE